MPRQLIEGIGNAIREKGQGLLDKLQSPSRMSERPISEMDGYHDEPLYESPSMEEVLRFNMPPREERTPPRPRSIFNEINESLVDSVVQVESSGNWDAVSRVGAIGLMQVRPQFAVQPGFGAKNVFDVAKSMGRNVNHIPRTPEGAERLLFDPEINRAYGTQYLKSLARAFDNNIEHALIAYNWGPNNTRRWIAEGADRRRLPRETQNYTKRIQSLLENGE